MSTNGKSELLLECRGIDKNYNGPQVLSGVDFFLRRGEIHALVGENGAGKSTLIKIITGITNRNAGTIAFDGYDVPLEHSKSASEKLGIAVIYQELSLIHGMTVAQNIFLTKEPLLPGLPIIDIKKMNQMAQAMIEKYGFDLKATDVIDRLPIAQRQTVEILKALSNKASLMIMDEPTSSLTATESERLFGIIRMLKAEGITVVYISHRMEEVYDLSDRVTVLRDGKLVSVLEGDEISPAEIIRLMIGRELTADESHHQMVDKSAGEVVLEVNQLSSEGKLKDISFKLHKGEVLGFGGLVGSGRTELMRAIYGIDPYDSGTIKYQGKPYAPTVEKSIASGFGFVPEERRLQGIMGAISITGNIGIPNLDSISNGAGFVSDSKELELSNKAITLLNVKPANPDVLVGNLSGGNQQKVVVGKWLIRNLKLLIVDEPTVGIDIGAKEEMYQTIERLSQEGVAVIVISSDLPELTRLSDRIIVLRKGRIIKEFTQGVVTEEQVLRAASGIVEGGVQ
ncbi:sugar ABC transporter ATP-binding protein [Propionivibrio soli]|uniref:sugar ABC transporter ATP-binding protein n=1 Tax=Propionivibrio soli TaxID=2976531 RepID=UPI0021E87BA7|nr:sugar ABC transporter ATP-binding protein [Propionivibrio soli]